MNIQGDEPLIDPGAIDAAVLALAGRSDEVPMGTLKKRIEDPREIADPERGESRDGSLGNAIYFSRLADSVCTRGSATLRRTSNISACTFTGGIFCWLSRPSGRAARTGGKTGTVARARKRIPHSRG